MEDTGREGSNIMRERLLERSFEAKADLIRYLDDDDTIMPHLKNVQSDFHCCDVIYTDANPPHKMSGDPVRDALGICPWSWIATADALLSIQKRQGFVWDSSKLCRQGGWCWYGFLKFGLVIKYVPIATYRYNPQSRGVSKHPDFKAQERLLAEEIRKLRYLQMNEAGVNRD